MKKLNLLLIAIVFFCLTGIMHGLEDISQINDGPYLFRQGEEITAKWIENGNLYEADVSSENFAKIKSQFGFNFSYKALQFEYAENSESLQSYAGVDSLVAISDIHGQYALYYKLLSASRVIDSQGNWNFGKGHLVIVGDVFDRGEKVTELLWHIFNLEKEAAQAGGKVHFLMGNHELMAMNSDLRYIHDKYKAVEKLTGKNYSQLFSERTVLGDWLRSKPVVIRINDLLFVHGGVSQELVNQNLTIERVNRLFKEKIYGRKKSEIVKDQLLELLYRSNGPIWYRGYFENAKLDSLKLNRILAFYNCKRVIVGHTSQDEIITRFNKKVFGIDSKIKNGKSGEILIYRSAKFYRGLINGDRIPL